MSATYDASAEWYAENSRAGTLWHPLNVPPHLELLGDVDGQRLCDLARGQGVFGRRLAQPNARVTGIELSEKPLPLARDEERHHPLGSR